MVAVDASASNLNVTKLLDILFTVEEMQTSIIRDDNSISKRLELDINRVNLIKEAYFIKYNIEEKDEEKVYNGIKKIINRKCHDKNKKSADNARQNE